MRTANVTYAPGTSETYPWNVGRYDDEYIPENNPEGYAESVGAIDHSNAIALADTWVNYRDVEHDALLHVYAKGIES